MCLYRSIKNIGDVAFDCQCLLHTYYSVPSIATTFVYGMKGHVGTESVTTGVLRGNSVFIDFMIRIC